MAQRIEMPYAVRVRAYNSGSSTNGFLWRYFETRQAAIKFAGHEKYVKYRPGHAWRVA